ncbi:MAG TPA: methylmalonyl Co-A mutase-associated GTPase MeaB [Bryobacteraceae bacterium]|nr:methylmalonyl Co-A mutase-associated GTPase MeaB [Bryobacteraceae bacterium]
MSFEPRVLAHLATGIENRDPHALAILDTLGRGHALVVGITGPPGAGKSTLVSAMAAELRRRDRTVAILAVDPTSRITGGAILGDRIRMAQHYADPDVFIRSIATRGAAGGIARATADLARLMDAAGKDYVLIETVGVGQDELEIAGVAQITVVVLVPGMGDDVQAIKAGILEIADVFVINKADQPGANRMEQELHAAFSLAEGPRPPIVQTVATEGRGIAELLDVLAALGAATPSRDRGGADLAATESAGPPRRQEGPASDRPTAADLAGLTAGDLHHAIAFYAPPGLQPTPVSVPDLSAAASQLSASGARLLNQPPAGGAAHLYVFVEPASARAVLLEITQESAS